ncbi:MULTISPECIES: VF530 family protein [unclassified Pseudoalteromonas]|uniref:VF530 family protein n=1 Tax=unclassified Pseudoalteromonas TaxID=194690 RepID=UPI001F26BB82|nr:VF530 family protein [Pseudoalteromonas sp. L1]WOC28717.1 VF530 family protein [Pseudoalteromonas sp. N1230-9]
MDNQPNNPLHGVKLADIVTKLQEKLGWDGLAAQIDVRCFQNDPSVKSSLKFLRKTPWAREKVEQLYIDTFSNTSNDDDAPFQWKSIKK